MKVLKSEYQIFETYSSFRTDINLFVDKLDYNKCNKIDVLREKLIDWEKNPYFQVTYIYSKNIIKISITHSEETFEEIKSSITQILNGNGTFLLMIANGQNYYRFLAEIFTYHLEI